MSKDTNKTTISLKALEPWQWVMALAVVVIVVGILVYQYCLVPKYEVPPVIKIPKKETKCSNIISATEMEKCLGREVKAVGVLYCPIPGIKGAGGLNFTDGTKLQFLEEISNCKKYSKQKVEVSGELYKCGVKDQCGGLGLRNIKSVNLISENQVTITTDKTEYEQGETVRIVVKNGLNKSIQYYEGGARRDFPFTIEKLEDAEWKFVHVYSPCVCGLRCHRDDPDIMDMKPGQEVKGEWGQMVCGESHIKGELTDEGNYRARFVYFNPFDPEHRSKNKFAIHSNEFRIKKGKQLGITPPTCSQACSLYLKTSQIVKVTDIIRISREAHGNFISSRCGKCKKNEVTIDRKTEDCKGQSCCCVIEALTYSTTTEPVLCWAHGSQCTSDNSCITRRSAAKCVHGECKYLRSDGLWCGSKGPGLLCKTDLNCPAGEHCIKGNCEQ